jgi:hypothetical protein
MTQALQGVIVAARRPAGGLTAWHPGQPPGAGPDDPRCRSGCFPVAPRGITRSGGPSGREPGGHGGARAGPHGHREGFSQREGFARA